MAKKSVFCIATSRAQADQIVDQLKAADFSNDNVPYVPKSHLKIAQGDIKEGDFVMALGYPGRTNRHRLPSEVEFTFGWDYPAFVKLQGELDFEALGRAVRMRHVPELHFHYDESVVRGAHLSALIERAVAEDSQHPVAAEPEDTKE